MSRTPPQSIVLDLDETLVHTFPNWSSQDYRQHKTKHPNDRRYFYDFVLRDFKQPPGTGAISWMAGVKRPSLDCFLDYCFSRFDKVIVWSAGQPDYVEQVVKAIFRGIDQPTAVYTWLDCARIKTKTWSDYHKPLRQIFQDFPDLNLTNTLILDDRLGNFLENPDNGLLIPAYKPKARTTDINAADDSLIRLVHWLATPEVRGCSDLRQLDKTLIWQRSLRELELECAKKAPILDPSYFTEDDWPLDWVEDDRLESDFQGLTDEEVKYQLTLDQVGAEPFYTNQEWHFR